MREKEQKIASLVQKLEERKIEVESMIIIFIQFVVGQMDKIQKSYKMIKFYL